MILLKLSLQDTEKNELKVKKKNPEYATIIYVPCLQSLCPPTKEDISLQSSDFF